MATIRVSENATTFVGSIEQESGVTPNDFSRIVQYRVVAENGEEAFYNVTVNNVLNEENSFLLFQFLAENNADLNQDVSATIDADNNIIVEFPIRAYSGDFTDLTASFEISNRSNTFVDDVVQVSGETVNDFVNTANYTVTAEDGTEANYSVTVTNLLNFENSILSFELSSDLNPGIFRTFATRANIDEKRIEFHNPHFNISSLVPTFELPFGATLSNNGVKLESGITAIDFREFVQLEVTAENGDIEIWEVEMTREIVDLEDFLSVCPLEDPNISIILSDFEFRLNGDVINQYPCVEPYYIMNRPTNALSPTEYFTETTRLQSLRFLYYLDYDEPYILPWSDKRLYDWVASKIDGINISDNISGGSCCTNIDGGKFINVGNLR